MLKIHNKREKKKIKDESETKDRRRQENVSRPTNSPPRPFFLYSVGFWFLFVVCLELYMYIFGSGGVGE